jgi:hypothetical protein
MKFACSWVLACTIAALGSAAHAFDVPLSGALSAADPTFSRPIPGAPPTSLSAAGTAVSYVVFPFFATTTAPYLAETFLAAFATGTADDTLIVEYRNAFVPSKPLVNSVAAEADSGARATQVKCSSS